MNSSGGVSPHLHLGISDEEQVTLQALGMAEVVISRAQTTTDRQLFLEHVIGRLRFEMEP